jgi:hypothetical protein
MRDLHAAWFCAAVISTGVVGLWGAALTVLRRRPGRAFLLAVSIASLAMLAQVAMGLILYADEALRARVPGLHVFYGMVILFVFAFAYIFRVQVARHPGLAWSVLLLFVMGLGLRAWMIAA